MLISESKFNFISSNSDQIPTVTRYANDLIYIRDDNYISLMVWDNFFREKKNNKTIKTYTQSGQYHTISEIHSKIGEKPLLQAYKNLFSNSNYNNTLLKHYIVHTTEQAYALLLTTLLIFCQNPTLII